MKRSSDRAWLVCCLWTPGCDDAPKPLATQADAGQSDDAGTATVVFQRKAAPKNLTATFWLAPGAIH